MVICSILKWQALKVDKTNVTIQIPTFDANIDVVSVENIENPDLEKTV